MRIESVYIDKFGMLRGFAQEFDAGCTVLLGANESGKTTLAAFVRAMLYGLNGKSASVAQNERKKYMPWGETAMGGSLRLTDGRDRYEIIRVFGQTKKSDTCRVIDAGTGEIVPIPAGQEPGDVLLGVEESVFADTLFVSFRGGRPQGGAALAERIRNRMDTGQEDVDLDRVLDRLQAAKSAIAPRVKDRGLLAQTQRELDETRRLLAGQKEAGRRIAALEEKLNGLSGSARAKAERREAILRSEESAAMRAKKIEERLKKAQKREKQRRICGLAAVVLFACAGICAAAAIRLGRHIWAAAAVFAAAGAVCLLVRRRAGKERAADLREELLQIGQDRAMLKRQLDLAEEGAEAQALAAHDEEWVQTRLALEREKQEMQDKTRLKEREAELMRREERLLKELAALELAQRELRAAAGERQSSTVPVLVREMEEMLCRLTEGKYDSAAVSGGLELSVRDENGALRSWEYFSAGTTEQMYLALRLSLVRMLAKTHGALPILLDDPFLHYDDARAKEALALLHAFAEQGHQVLLMTCREREAAGAEHVIRMERGRRKIG